MKNKNIINPISLKGKEIHERQLALMGVKTINENENKGNTAVELTKIGPDGNAYAIIRENHEYFIKRTNKTSGLVLEDFKYIGGLQNKKDEAYPSYAKAIKHLNLKFKSLAESYDKGSNINVFEDDNLLEHHPYKADQDLSATKGMGDGQEYVVDKNGTPLSNKAKVGKEKGQFGDNLADGKACDDCEEVKVNEGFGMGFSGEGNLEGNKPMSEFDDKAMQNFIDQYGEERGKQVYYATANKQDRNPETFEKTEGMTSFGDDVELNEFERAIEEMMARYNEESNDLYEKFPDLTGDGKVTRADILKGRGVKFEEELHGGQHKLDIEADDLKKVRAGALGEDFDGLAFAIRSASGDEVQKTEEDPNGNPIYTSNLNTNLQYFIGPNNSIVQLDKTTGKERVMGNLDHYGGEPRPKDLPGEMYYEESIEEAIKRLDALLEGELKKKALK